jgi:hypothetical protein
MGNPTSKGVGSGTAVIHDNSLLTDTMAETFRNIRGDVKENKKKKAAAESNRQKALGELSGAFGDYDTSKMREADKEAAVKMNEDGYKMFDGNWDKVLNGDPYWSNLYREQMNKQKIFISNSVESKGEMKDLYATINEPDSGYSPEKKKQMEEYMLTTGSTMKDMKERGLYARDLAREGHVKNLKTALEDSFFEKGAYMKKNSDGSSYSKEKNVIMDDSQTLPLFKSYVDSNAEVLQDMVVAFPIVEGAKGYDEDGTISNAEDQYKAYHDVTKDLMRPDLSKVKITEATDKDTSGDGFGDKRDKYDFAIRSEESNKRGGRRGESTDLDVITIGKKSGSALSPITANGKVGVVAEARKNSKGDWEIVRSITKDDLSGNITVTGETVIDPLDKNMQAHLESEYGIKDLNEFAKQLKGKNSQSDSAPQVGTESNGYRFNGGNPNDQKNWTKIK